jgi:hypothetical protein
VFILWWLFLHLWKQYWHKLSEASLQYRKKNILQGTGFLYNCNFCSFVLTHFQLLHKGYFNNSKTDQRVSKVFHIFQATVIFRNEKLCKCLDSENKAFHPQLEKEQFKTHILIGHLPVGSLSVRHNFPHYYSIAPDITGWGELAESYCFWGSPSDWNFATLKLRKLF